MISRYTLNKFEIHISLIKCKKKIQFCTRVILAIKSIQARRYHEKIKKNVKENSYLSMRIMELLNNLNVKVTIFIEYCIRLFIDVDLNIH